MFEEVDDTEVQEEKGEWDDVLQQFGPLQKFLSFVAFCSVGLTTAFVALPDQRDVANDSNESTESQIQLGFVWIQGFLSIGGLALQAFAFVLSLSWSVRRKMVYIAFVVANLLGCLVDVLSLGWPTPLRLAFIYSSLSLHSLQVLCGLVILWRYSRIQPKSRIPPSFFAWLRDSSQPSETATLLHLEQHVYRKKLRKGARNVLREGQWWVAVLTSLLFALMAGTLVFQLGETVSTNKEFFPLDELAAMNDPTTIMRDYVAIGGSPPTNQTSSSSPATAAPSSSATGASPSTNATNASRPSTSSSTATSSTASASVSPRRRKVVLVVLDGMRFDVLNYSAPFQAMLQETSFAANSLTFHMEAQLPSMSLPNWLTIITGVRPELTGVWGNLLVPETNFDTIFRVLKSFDINTMITSSPWFVDLVLSQLPSLLGNGAVPFSYSASDPYPTADTADRKRGSLLLQAVQSGLYGFMLGHFSNIDLQGHLFGSHPEEPDDRYYAAVANETQILQSLLPHIDEDTLLAITADHGHLGVGGHGSTEYVLRDVPFIAFQPNSSLPALPSPPANTRQPYQNLDIAPTVCAMMGVPVPRQALGQFIAPLFALLSPQEQLVAYRDMFVQKRLLLKYYLGQLGRPLPRSMVLNGVTAVNYANNLTIPELQSRIEAIVALIDEERASAINNETWRNSVMAAVICVAALSLLSFVYQRLTFCDLISLLPFWESTAATPQNRKFFGLAFLLVAVYYALSIGMFVVLVRFAAFFPSWDSATIHYPPAFFHFVFMAIGPSTVAQLLLLNVYQLPYVKSPATASALAKLRYYARFAFTISQTEFTDLGSIYLCKYYLVYASVVAVLVLQVLESLYSFMLPLVFKVYFITPFVWDVRFRVITTQLLSIPLVAGNLVALFFWPRNSLSAENFDPLYALFLQKECKAAHLLQEEYHEALRFLNSAQGMRTEDSLHANATTAQSGLTVELLELPNKAEAENSAALT